MGLLCARGRRTSRCRLLRWPCFSGMVNLTCEAVDGTAQVCVACLGFRNMPRRVGQTPQSEYHEEQKKPPKEQKRLLVEFVFFRFCSNLKSKCLLGDSLFDQSDANQIKRKKCWRNTIERNLVTMGILFLSSQNWVCCPNICVLLGRKAKNTARLLSMLPGVFQEFSGTVSRFSRVLV